MTPEGVALFRCIESSYRTLVHHELVAVSGDDRQRARWLYEDAPFGVLAHDGGADPHFVYANRQAQHLFECRWDDLVGTPSRESAGPDEQSDRNRLLDEVSERGWTDGYRGIRLSKKGNRFWIKDVLLWNLLDTEGERCGQAAILRRWQACQ